MFLGISTKKIFRGYTTRQRAASKRPSSTIKKLENGYLGRFSLTPQELTFTPPKMLIRKNILCLESHFMLPEV